MGSREEECLVGIELHVLPRASIGRGFSRRCSFQEQGGNVLAKCLSL